MSKLIGIVHLTVVEEVFVQIVPLALPKAYVMVCVKLELALLMLMIAPSVTPAVVEFPLPHEMLEARGIVFNVKLLEPLQLIAH